jgi:hypothetical protein
MTKIKNLFLSFFSVFFILLSVYFIIIRGSQKLENSWVLEFGQKIRPIKLKYLLLPNSKTLSRIRLRVLDFDDFSLVYSLYLLWIKKNSKTLVKWSQKENSMIGWNDFLQNSKTQLFFEFLTPLLSSYPYFTSVNFLDNLDRSLHSSI